MEDSDTYEFDTKNHYSHYNNPLQCHPTAVDCPPTTHPHCQGDCHTRLEAAELELAKQLDSLRELQWQLEGVTLKYEHQQSETPMKATLSSVVDQQQEERTSTMDTTTSTTTTTTTNSANQYTRVIEALSNKVEELSGAVQAAEGYQQRAQQAEQECLLLKQKLERDDKLQHQKSFEQHIIAGMSKENDALSKELKELRAKIKEMSSNSSDQTTIKAAQQQQPEAIKLSTSPLPIAIRSIAVDATSPEVVLHTSTDEALEKTCKAQEQQINHLLKTIQHLELQLANCAHHTSTHRNMGQKSTTTTDVLLASSNNNSSSTTKGEKAEDLASNHCTSCRLHQQRVTSLEAENAQMFDTLVQAQAEAAKYKAIIRQNNNTSGLDSYTSNTDTTTRNESATSLSVDMLQRRIKALETQNLKLRLSSTVADTMNSPRGSMYTTPGVDVDYNNNVVAVPIRAPLHVDRNYPPSSVIVHQEAEKPAVAKWQADKKLQRKVKLLETQLTDSSTALIQAKEASTKLSSELDTLKQDLNTSYSTNKDLKSRIRGLEEKLASFASTASVPAAKVKTLLTELSTLQARHDDLERQLVMTRYNTSSSGIIRQQQTMNTVVYPSSSAPVSPHTTTSGGMMLPLTNNTAMLSAPSRPLLQPPPLNSSTVKDDDLDAVVHAKEMMILQLKLERDQAKAQVDRLQRRLDALFEDLQVFKNHTTSMASSLLLKATSTATTTSSKRGGVSTKRERELLDTISLLKNALERTKKGLETGVSSTKYMAAVDKIKQLKAQVTQLEQKLADGDTVQAELHTAQSRIGQLETLVSALRGQLRLFKRKITDNTSIREDIMNAQVAELERAIAVRDVELAGLRHGVCQEARVLAQEGLTPKELVRQLLNARAQLREMEEQHSAMHAQILLRDQ